MGFTKLDEHIVESSIWDEPPETRLVWITFLARCDSNGFVRGTVNTIQRAANVSQDGAAAAIKTLEGPDAASRTKTDDGRRIRAVDGGWEVINYRLYREMHYEEERREQKKMLMRELRSKQKQESDDVVTVGNELVTSGNELVTGGNRVVTTGNSYASASASASVEGSAEGSDGQPKQPEPVVPPEPLNNPDFLAAWSKWRDYRRKMRKPINHHGQDAAWKKLAKWGVVRAIEAIENSMAHGWQGIYEENNGTFGKSNSGNSTRIVADAGKYADVSEVIQT